MDSLPPPPPPPFYAWTSPSWAARREKIRSRRNILASIQIWRLFIANGYGDLLPLRIDATDSQFRRPLPIGCGLFFGSTFYQMSKVRNPLYCISEWSLSLLYCMCITDTARIGACSFVPIFLHAFYCALVELIYVHNHCASLCLRFSCIV